MIQPGFGVALVVIVQVVRDDALHAERLEVRLFDNRPRRVRHHAGRTQPVADEVVGGIAGAGISTSNARCLLSFHG